MSEAIREVSYLSALDQTMQPALFAPASGNEPRPLLVSLHTWSADLTQSSAKYFVRAAERNWHCIYPNFRGPNWQTEACGSDLVVSDLAGAVAYVKENYNVDENRVYLLGGSGGGHVSLLMAARHPELWSAVSSWCPISDLVKWYDETEKHPETGAYYKHISEACGGDPRTDKAAFDEAMKRSPVTYLKASAGKCIVDIGTGIHDGHRGSVPVSQTLEAFNLLAAPEDQISEEDIRYITEKEEIPAHLKFLGFDPAYGEKKVLFRRISGMVRVTVFEGSHDLLPGPGFGFLERQQGGEVPVWFSGDIADFRNDSALEK